MDAANRSARPHRRRANCLSWPQRMEQKEIDVSAMASGALGSSEDGPAFDDGTGTVAIWRIESLALAEWPEERHGEFYAGDCFLVRYTYTNPRGKEQHVVYFWQGRHSSTDEKGASALLTTKMCAELVRGRGRRGAPAG